MSRVSVGQHVSESVRWRIEAFSGDACSIRGKEPSRSGKAFSVTDSLWGASMRRGRILLLAKAPEPGKVKTRLIPVLGEQGAAELQKRLIRNALDRVIQLGMPPTELWCAPDSASVFFRELAREYSLSPRDQTGGDLGERMLAAARDGLAEADYVILMGTDSPELSPHWIRRASDALASGRDAAICPALDGGYVLLGLSRLHENLFRDMPWGTESVLDETMQRLAENGFSREELPPCGDLDRPEDLKRLYESSRPELQNLVQDLHPGGA